MGNGEIIACIFVLLLALYGCAQLIRRLCLWVTRCPGCAVCCRLAVPRNRAALVPLLRCLESQAVWDDPTGCRHTLVLLPELDTEQQHQLERAMEEAPSVIPVTASQLHAMLLQLATEDTNEDKEN